METLIDSVHHKVGLNIVLPAMTTPTTQSSMWTNEILSLDTHLQACSYHRTFQKFLVSYSECGFVFYLCASLISVAENSSTTT